MNRSLRVELMKSIATALFVTFVAALPAIASDSTETPEVAGATVAEPTPTPAAVTGTKRALILCGLSGDADHHKLFAETVGKLHDGLSKQLGFASSEIVVLFGDDAKETDTDLIKSAARATREELEKKANGLREALQPVDTLWVIVLGHSHYDGKHSWLNLPGPDMHQADFAKLFNGVPSREQVFFITTPTSGFYIKPLSAKGRVVISATEEGYETNETEFPHELARVLTAPPATKEFDVDEDGALSLFDLYVTVARNLAESYSTNELLATEHPLLDDNGDGRGTEMQIDFLTEEQGGRAKCGRTTAPAKRMTSDGGVAKSIVLPWVKIEAAPTRTE